MTMMRESVRHLRALIYGDTGTGKSALGATAPRPVVLLTEVQGYQSIVDTARRIGRPVPPVFHVDSADLMRASLDALRQPDPMRRLVEVHGGDLDALPYLEPESVVIDSVTELAALIEVEMLMQSPPKPARDGLPEKTPRHWGTLLDRGTTLFRVIRDLPYHVITLANLRRDEWTDEATGVSQLRVEPDLPTRRLVGRLTRTTNLVGISFVDNRIENGKRARRHLVKFIDSDAYVLKPLRPLRAVEVPDVSDWIARWNNRGADASGTLYDGDVGETADNEAATDAAEGNG